MLCFFLSSWNKRHPYKRFADSPVRSRKLTLRDTSFE